MDFSDFSDDDDIEIQTIHDNLIEIGEGLTVSMPSSHVHEMYPVDDDLEKELNEYDERLEKEKEAEKKRLEEEKLANENANATAAGDSSSQNPKNDAAPQPTANVDTDVVDGSKEAGKKRAEKKKTSPVWNYFEVVIEDGKRCGKCLYCERIVPAVSQVNGTSALWSHARNCSKNPDLQDPKQTKLQFLKVTDKDGNVVATPGKWLFNPVKARRSISIMIILDELPFSIVEKLGFLYMIEVLTPPEFNSPSRRTITRECLSVYCEKRDELRNYFRDNNVRVSLTTDCWTSAQKANFMSLTAHWIDQDWKLHKKVLCFVPVDNHKGEHLADRVERCLMEWGICKVYCVTVDNATANDVMIKKLKESIKRWKTGVLDCEDMHMRCVAHITNLVVQGGLSMHHESVERIRVGCRFLRLSASRLKKFKEEVELDGKTWSKNICIDVPHRWNSCYKMLERARQYDTAFTRLDKVDKAYTQELKNFIPTEQDWEIVNKLIEFLEHFYHLTLKVSDLIESPLLWCQVYQTEERFESLQNRQHHKILDLVSGSLYPTSNLFLSEIYGIDSALKDWDESTDAHFKAMAGMMRDKFDKYWDDPSTMNKNLFYAVVLDPSQKMKFVEFALKDMYGEEKGSMHAQMVLTGLKKLFGWYRSELEKNIDLERPQKRARVDDSTSQQSTGARKARVPEPQEKLSTRASRAYQKFMEKEVCVESELSELDFYLSESVVQRKQGDDSYDVLSWWNLNAARFPTLAAMARDIVAIPISTVASESVFSTSGRILDDFRSSLTPKMAQALICAQDWFRSEFEGKFWKGKKDYMDIDDDDEIEVMEEMTRERGIGKTPIY